MIIGFAVIPLIYTIKQIRSEKRDRAKKLELIQRRLAQKESKRKLPNITND